MDNVEDLEITIWCIYHRPGGFVKTLYMWSDEDKALVREQLGKGLPEINEENPFSEEQREDITLNDVLKLVSKIDTNPIAAYEYNRMGGSFFGIRIAHGYNKTTFEWHGSVDTTDSAISRLYTYVQEL